VLKTISLPKNQTFLKDAILVVGASLLIGLAGQLYIPLPFSPVGLFLRNNLVLLLAVLLGPKRATLAVAGFLLQGALGLPVFVSGGLAGPLAGYLVGYVAAAYVTGRLAGENPTAKRSFLAMGAGALVIYLFGFFGLMPFVGGAKSAIYLGVLPFIPGDLLKLVLCTKLLGLRRRA